MITIRSLENPLLLPPERRGHFYRAYWWHRVIGGAHPEVAGAKAFAQASDPAGDDTTTLEGERKWLRERGAER